jgi:hypothetical protein
MPNDCWNTISIKATNEQINSILSNDFQSFPPSAFKKIQFGKEMIIFKLWSAWGPDSSFIETLFNKYENIWILNMWHEEGGNAGVIVGTKDNISELSWDEGCIEEIVNRMRDGDTMPEPVFQSSS